MVDELTKRKAWLATRPLGLWYAWSQPYWLILQQREREIRESKWKLGHLLDYPVWPDFLLEEGSDQFMFRECHRVQDYHTFTRPEPFIRFAESLGMPYHLAVLNAKHLVKQLKGKNNGETITRTSVICSTVERIPPRTDSRYTEILLSEEQSKNQSTQQGILS